MTIVEGNVGVAIGLVCGSGAATAIGASVVFFPSVVKLASRRVLAAALGVSAGVMIYVSFLEIFPKSVAGFAEAGVEDGTAYIYTTLSFFGGVVFMKIVDVCVKLLSGEYATRRRDVDEDVVVVWNEDQVEESDGTEIIVPHPHCVGCSHDPVGELNEWQEKAELELQAMRKGQDHHRPRRVPPILERNETCSCNEDEGSGGTGKNAKDKEDPQDVEACNVDEEKGPSVKKNKRASQDLTAATGLDSHHRRETIERFGSYEANEGEGEPIVVVVENVPRDPDEDSFFRAPMRSKVNPQREKKRLVKMGFSTALAIAVHNFPEGLATFISVLDNPSVGAVLAIAIGIHNIPEGLCVALPIYYATGNRWKAFMWGCLSGLSEPVAAILGWLVLATVMSDLVYALLFGLVSGMMVMISLKELVPTAHRYDPEDTVVTYSVIVGMAIMALSLGLFKFSK